MRFDKIVPPEITKALDPICPVMEEVLESFHKLRSIHPAARNGVDEMIREMHDALRNTDIYGSSIHHGGNCNGRRQPERDFYRGRDYDGRGSQQRYEDRVDDANEYLQRNFLHLDRNRDGQITRGEIDRASRNAREEKDAPALSHLKTLEENYDEIKNSFRERFETHGITRADARETNADLDRNRQIRDFSKSLNKDGLFSALDSAKNGEHDGQISKGDLKKFMMDSMHMHSRGRNDGVHTPENMRVVADMLKQWDDPNSAVYQMRDGERLMTRRTIREAGQENQFGPERPQQQWHQKQWSYRDK